MQSVSVNRVKGRKLRFGIIGLGKMGLLHASLLSTFENAQVVALCDKSALMTRVCKSIFSSTEVVVVNSIERFNEFALDAVYITTPISSHFSIVKDLYTRGIVRNIFTEKTLASNYNQAKEMSEMAKKIGGLTMVGYMKRFSVVFRKAKELLAEGNLGEPLSFNAYAYSSDFLGLTKDSKSSASRGGALKDIGCHIIDLSLWLFGDLKIADVISCNKIGDSETAVSFTTNSNGLVGRFDISQRMPNYRMPEFGCSVACSKGQLNVNDDQLRLNFGDGAQKIWYRHDLQDNVRFWLGETEYYRENQEFVNSLLENRAREPNFDSALKVDYVIDQVRQGAAKV
jgi:predicted dehydrogenase